MSDQLRSPLLDADSGILDARQRKVIAGVVAAERIQILDLPTDDPLDAKRHARVVATGPELRAQPDAVIASVQHNDDVLDAVAKRLSTGMRRIVLVGCGDSLAVMVAARQALEPMLGVPCEPVQSLEFAYYQAELVDDSHGGHRAVQFGGDDAHGRGAPDGPAAADRIPLPSPTPRVRRCRPRRRTS